MERKCPRPEHTILGMAYISATQRRDIEEKIENLRKGPDWKELDSYIWWPVDFIEEPLLGVLYSAWQGVGKLNFGLMPVFSRHRHKALAGVGLVESVLIVCGINGTVSVWLENACQDTE